MEEGKPSKQTIKLLKNINNIEIISYRPTFHPTSSLQKAECKQWSVGARILFGVALSIVVKLTPI